MADTAQPLAAAETEPVSKDAALAGAADAFKIHLGQMDAPEPVERPRGPDGKFISADGAEEGDEGEEIEGEAEPGAGEAEPESDDDEDEGGEAAEEAQPEAVELPTSWPADKAELWSTLPTDAQAFLRQRDAELISATNAKFMEAANVAKSAQQIATEAQTSRERALEATEIALAMFRPQEPAVSMLDPNSSDYDPDRYHLAKAYYDQDIANVNRLATQREQLRAQEQQDAQRQDAERIQAINQATIPALVRDVPDLNDANKATAILRELAEYAIRNGAPAELFNGPTTALEWHMIWKAREYDRNQEAKAKVKTDPKPEPKKAGPAVRPGVATPPSARKAARVKADIDRLHRSGSIQDGAAVFKHFLSKG